MVRPGGTQVQVVLPRRRWHRGSEERSRRITQRFPRSRLRQRRPSGVRHCYGHRANITVAWVASISGSSCVGAGVLDRSEGNRSVGTSGRRLAYCTARSRQAFGAAQHLGGQQHPPSSTRSISSGVPAVSGWWGPRQPERDDWTGDVNEGNGVTVTLKCRRRLCRTTIPWPPRAPRTGLRRDRSTGVHSPVWPTTR